MKAIKSVLNVMAIVAMVMCVNPAFAQNSAKERRQAERTVREQIKELYQKPDKMVKKEAKRLMKEGWKTMDLPIEKQLERMYEKIVLTDEEGMPKYIYVTTQATGGSFSAAQSAADNIAKIRISSNIASSITSLTDVALANNEITPSQAASLTKVVENAKNLVSQKLGRTIPAVSLYKQDRNGYEIRYTVLYDMRSAMDMMKQTVLEDLKEDSEMNRAQLEAILGMDKLVNQFEVENIEE